ncbi:GAF domain-containing protein [Lipingzhangella sp. LS1_29]|uniref:GAF domain-containing protein n=1 Tax=Lipingzhangella rawalii TaxID=2055835 RepID=A0ABU2H561_9ACTN|nr:GAF domain-containing protein [Lipingzhangella rawalii]MDS1270447.1 GAF domain-containing protein [Lipingzhangella rawalii]
MRYSSLDTALPAGVDHHSHARTLYRVHEAVLAGQHPPVRPREVIAESWHRVRSQVDPDRGRPPRILEGAQLDRLRTESPLAELLPMLSQALVTVAEDARHVLLVTDPRGRILWRDGPAPMRRLADGAGLVEGAGWDEATVGTNAIGTALVLGEPTQVYSAEHFARNLHQLTCACAPVVDPRDGSLLGAIDVTGPASSAHPTTLALVHSVAQLAQAQLRGHHHAHLERLRASAAPVLARLTGKALVVDRQGWTAAAQHLAPVRRLMLPRELEAGTVWLGELGLCSVEPLPGGWLIRPGGGEVPGRTHVRLDLSGAQAHLVVTGPSGQRSHPLSLRHAELLLLLSRHPDGCSAAQLARALFGDPSRAVTVRAELARLRRQVGAIVASRPYRCAPGVNLEACLPTDAASLLPGSTAPGVRRIRRDLMCGETGVAGAEPATGR